METAQNIRTIYNFQDRTHNNGDLAHYECLASALLQIGKWLSALRNFGVYDNTRIIIVGDHGNGVIPVFHDGFTLNDRYGSYHTLLMVKDFDSNGEFRTDDSFMTNADTVWLSLDGLSLDMKNPYTGRNITNGNEIKSRGINVFQQEEDANPLLYVNYTTYTIDIKDAYHVSNNIYKESNWIPLVDWLREHPEDTLEGIGK